VRADEGYCGTFGRLAKEVFSAGANISKQIKPKFEILPKRWHVECAFFLTLNSSRRPSKDYEVNTASKFD
jgi:transposase